MVNQLKCSLKKKCTKVYGMNLNNLFFSSTMEDQSSNLMRESACHLK